MVAAPGTPRRRRRSPQVPAARTHVRQPTQRPVARRHSAPHARAQSARGPWTAPQWFPAIDRSLERPRGAAPPLSAGRSRVSEVASSRATTQLSPSTALDQIALWRVARREHHAQARAARAGGGGGTLDRTTDARPGLNLRRRTEALRERALCRQDGSDDDEGGQRSLHRSTPRRRDEHLSTSAVSTDRLRLATNCPVSLSQA